MMNERIMSISVFVVLALLLPGGITNVEENETAGQVH